jgi:hypothetical protein
VALAKRPVSTVCSRLFVEGVVMTSDFSIVRAYKTPRIIASLLSHSSEPTLIAVKDRMYRRNPVS